MLDLYLEIQIPFSELHLPQVWNIAGELAISVRTEASQLVGMSTKDLKSCAARLNLKNELSEINQSQKDKHQTVPLMWGT